jgi:hypothetical protein
MSFPKSRVVKYFLLLFKLFVLYFFPFLTHWPAIETMGKKRQIGTETYLKNVYSCYKRLRDGVPDGFCFFLISLDILYELVLNF